MTSFLTQRHRAYVTAFDNTQPTAALPIARHSQVALARSRGTGSGGSGRNRRRGSPFAALSDAYKPSRLIFPSPTGRDGGEVVALRSATFAWPTALERGVAADPRHLKQDRYAPQTLGLPTTPLRSTVQNATTPTGEQGKIEATKSTARVAGAERDVAAVRDGGLAVPREQEEKEASEMPKLLQQSTDTTSRPPTSRRRVTWADKVEIREVTRSTICEVFAPDLHSLEIARRLAILAEEPELTRVVEAVRLVRRQAAGVVRSLTARQGWNGSLDGVEEACRLWSWRERTYMGEMDELVSFLSPRQGGGSRDGRKTDGSDVWRLKATYRAARRRMEDADSD